MNKIVRYEDIVDLDKIKSVYNVIRKNTKNKNKLFKFEMFYTANVNNIYYILKNKLYKHSKYNIFLIREPKYRVIMSEIISDKIVNHLISKYVLLPLIEPKLINSNVATRKNKGTTEGIRLLKKYINSLKINNEHIYVLKCDIKKYFYNIDHEILLKKLRTLIKDEDLYSIIKNVVSSTNEEYINIAISATLKDKGEKVKNSVALYKCNKGLPIGNMTSQILAIFYLNELDHYIKEKLYCRYYIRYMDDIVILSESKIKLNKIKEKIENKLKKLKLKLNGKTNIYRLDKGFNFLGYYYYLKNKRLIIKLKSETKRRIVKKIIKDKGINSGYNGYLAIAHSGAIRIKIKTTIASC